MDEVCLICARNMREAQETYERGEYVTLDEARERLIKRRENERRWRPVMEKLVEYAEAKDKLLVAHRLGNRNIADKAIDLLDGCRDALTEAHKLLGDK